MYSQAQILLLDDILSALDVHTAKWIAEECLAGHLVKSRTVILVTHNVLLASAVVDYSVVLNADGTVNCQGPIDRLLSEERHVLEKVEKDAVDEDEAKVDEKDQDKLKKGKQIVAEEIAVGHIGWPVCKL